ncbi:MAG: hypothetical protein HYY06_21375 [Deltaproteobacteria bacterium]|nr:hypothetical protein [Deltaproteobacteria bacterium]
MRSARFFMVLLGLALVTGPGCGGGDGETGKLPPGEDPEPDSEGDFRLEFVTGPEISLARGAQADLAVRYIDPKGEPASGNVWFDVAGDARGSTLSSQGNPADEEGEASVKLRAGSNDATFDVVVSADYADSIEFGVSVSASHDGGDLRVSVTYDGVRRLHGADIYIYEGRDCAGIDPRQPPPADLLQSVQSIRDDATFQGLQAGSRWAVLAAAINDTGYVASWGCWPEARIEDGRETLVELPLQDIPVDAAGRWELENHFNMGEALPDDVDTIFDALAEMSDDPNDPATYILDQVREQIDNEALRFAFDAARIYWNLDAELNEQIDDAAPGFVLDAMSAAGDLGRALNDMQIDSDMTFGQPDEFGVINAEHQLIDLVMTLDGVTNRFSMADDVGLGGTTARNVMVGVLDEQTATIDPHEFRMGMGTLVLFALNNVVLPRFDGAPGSVREMLEGAVDCSSVGEWLSDTVDMGAPSMWEDLCGFALAAASLYAEQQILGMNDTYDTLTLAGTASIKDPNGDLGFDRLDDGVWSSTWSGNAGSVQFPGSFQGTRY